MPTSNNPGTLKLTAADLARFIDHTLLKADASARDLEKLCAEARAHAFYAVCVNPSRIELCRHLLEDTAVQVATVVGFPLGAMESDAKRYETEAAIDAGAHEIEQADYHREQDRKADDQAHENRAA